MGWWKMAIFHFKHSYLNWRAIPCKRRNDLRFCGFFIIFSTFFSFRPSRIFQVHDMTINFSFALFFLFFFDLSTLGNDVCHRWLSKLKHHFSYEDCFGFWLFGPKVFIPILLIKRGSWLKSISEKWAILVNVPQGINRGYLRISWS